MECREIKKSYPMGEEKGSRPVLNSLCLSVKKGDITVLLGHSGCGKTTLLRIMGGLETLDSGEVTGWEGERCAFVFQEPRLMPWLSLYRNVGFGLSQKELDKRELLRLIELVGLSGFERAKPHQLSGGMQQRCALARALAIHPTYLLMDEPFAALDYFTREQMQKELLRIKRKEGVSIVFVTHSIDEALLIGNRIAIMGDGRIQHHLEIGEDTEGRDLRDRYFLSRKEEIIRYLEFQ